MAVSFATCARAPRGRGARARRGAARAARGNKGFGRQAPAPPPLDAADAAPRGARAPPRVVTSRRQVDQILRRQREEQGGAGHPRVDYEAAQKGRADFVRVANWGGGKTDEDLSNLRVRAHAESYSDTFAEAPLFEELTKRLNLLETNNELGVATLGKLPPFERWSFAEGHYAQYLADLGAVHAALEGALDAAASAAAAAAVAKGAGEAAARADALLSALDGDAVRGLRRSAAIEADLKAIVGAADMPAVAEAPAPSTNAAAYASVLTRLGRRVAADDADADPDKRLTAARQLFTHAFCLYLALLGTGQRMGARAVEALPVRQNGALALYTAYPERVGNPLVTLKAAVDGADGGAPDEAAREALMQELPAAIQRASLMLAPLAVTA